MHWLAEDQLGLASKGAFLAIIPLLILIVTEVLVNRKEKKHMNRINAPYTLSIIVAIVNNLSGNIAGGALLANALYGLRFVGMINGTNKGKKTCSPDKRRVI